MRNGDNSLVNALLENNAWRCIRIEWKIRASVVFGSFGFGATELFRRSFSEIFFGDGASGGSGGEIVLLLAAGVVCVLASLAAAPFEILRVRSMGY